MRLIGFALASKVLFDMTVLTSLTIAPRGITNKALVRRLALFLNGAGWMYAVSALTHLVT